MKNDNLLIISILTIGIILLMSCNNFNKESSFVDESGFTVKGPKFIDKKNGRYFYYYPNGNLRGIYNYKDGCINGDMFYIEVDSSMNSSYFVDCKPQYIYTISKHGDTLFYFKKNRMISYFKNKSINELVYFGENRNSDKKIVFDSLGRLNNFTSPLDFLTNEDSIHLDIYCPDWKVQINERGR